MQTLKPWAILALLLSASPALAALETGTTPAWLPRAVWAGYLSKDGAGSPQVRVQWEGKLFEQSRDMLAWVAEVGGGYGTTLPDDVGIDENVTMTYLYQHAVTAGIAYRGWRFERLRWGLQFTVGPYFYGARFDALPKENRITGIVEGRANLGWDFGPITVGAAGGYADTFSRPFLSKTAPYTGGWMAGLYVDWWH